MSDDDELRRHARECERDGIAFAAVPPGELLRLLPPADDGEPVTEEWIRAVGWGCGEDGVEGYTRSDAWLGFAVRAIHGPGEVGWQAFQVDADGFDGSENYLCLTPTRGHVRRLCAALGVPLTPAGG